MNLKSLVVFLIIFFYLAPAFIQYDFTSEGRIQGFELGLPQVLAGDIPHYLIMINSLIYDYDLKLKNNYDSVLLGGVDAGERYRGKEINHHVRFINKTNGFWLNSPEDLFNSNGKYIAKTPSIDSNEFEYYSYHPVGLPILSAFFLWPLKNTGLIESGVIFLSIFVSLISLLFLYKILKFYSDERVALIITFFFAVGTQIWHYSNTFWTEPFIMFFIIVSYYFFIIKNQNVLPGILIGYAMLIKHPVAFLALVFIFYRLFEKKIWSLIKFTLPVLVLGVSLVWYYIYTYGFLTGPREMPLTLNPAEGLWGLLFSTQNGLFFFAPFLVFAIFGVREFYLRHKKHALFTYSLFLIYYLFWGFVSYWWGGGYSSRYIIPLVPLFALPMAFWFKSNKSLFLKNVFYFLLFISVFINFQAVLFYPLFWDNPPWALIKALIFKFGKIKSFIF